MEKLEHDPRSKQQIKDALFTFLYAPVKKQFQGRIDTLVERNTLIGGYSHQHFIYKGVLYNSAGTVPPLKKNRLFSVLRTAMDEYLADLDQLNNNELPFVLGFINQVLNSSSDLTDYLRILPESMHYPLEALIATCPCRSTSLTEAKVASLKSKNQDPINFMKQRLVTNLLI